MGRRGARPYPVTPALDRVYSTPVKTLASLALVVSLASVLLVYGELRKQGQRIDALEESVTRLQEQLDKPKSAGLDLQAKCADGAKRASDDGWHGSKMSSYTNHYNASLNK